MLKNIEIKKMKNTCEPLMVTFDELSMPEKVIQHIFNNHYIFVLDKKENYVSAVSRKIEGSFRYAKDYGKSYAETEMPVYSGGEVVYEKFHFPLYLRPLMVGVKMFKTGAEIKEWLFSVPSLVEELMEIYSAMEILADGFEASKEEEKNALSRLQYEAQEMLNRMLEVSEAVKKI